MNIYILDIEVHNKSAKHNTLDKKITLAFSTEEAATAAIFDYVGVDPAISTLGELRDNNQGLYWSIVKAPLDMNSEWIIGNTKYENEITTS